MSNSNNSQETESILNIVNKIKSGNIVLPEFQRDFVWDITKTFDLFDSLVRDVFIGSIIYGIPKFGISTRDIDDRPRKKRGLHRDPLTVIDYTQEQIEAKTATGNFRLVLDGQQRITSIYRALIGVDEIWFIVKNFDELNDDIKDKNLDNYTLEDLLYMFSNEEPIDHLAIKLSDVYQMTQESTMRESMKKGKYFDCLKFILNTDKDSQEYEFNLFLIVSNKLQDLYKHEKLLSYFLLNMDSERFALFFERSNSKGIRLSFIDILVAKLYHGFNLRKAINDFNSNNSYELIPEIIVRAIAFQVSGGKQVDKSYILNKLNADHFNKYWDLFTDAYKKSIDYLISNHYMIDINWIPYYNMLIPLVLFTINLPSRIFNQMDSNQKAFIAYWYWAAAFSQHYTQSTNDTIISDSKALMQIAKNKKIDDYNFFRKLDSQVKSDTDILQDEIKVNSSIYKGIINLINYNSGGLREWKHGGFISSEDKLEDHHIFPVRYLQSLNGDDEIDIDCVANKTLIPKIPNIKIGKRKPGDYLQEIQSSNPKLDETLKYHLIPSKIISGYYDDKYNEFLADRSKLIFEQINKHVLLEQDEIRANYYEVSKSNKLTTIPIYAKYQDKIIKATFLKEMGIVILDGISYSASAAAKKVKSKISGEEVSTNGSKFWKYTDQNGIEQNIDNLRN